jgi:carbamoyltransferase
MNIIGISALFHDAACCVLRDGRLVAAAEEERFSRDKHDASMPWRAFRYCLREARLDISDIDCVAYYESPTEKLGRQLWMSLPRLPISSTDPASRLDAKRAERQIRRTLGYEGPIEFVGHHLSHASSAYHYSGFSDAAILTVDGVGEWTTTSYARASGTAIELIEDVEFPHSIGLLYSAVTDYLGFEVNEGEYKVMGLAPYGQPLYVDQFRKLFRSDPDGRYELDLKYFRFDLTDRMYSDELVALLGREGRAAESEIEPFHTHVAASLQRVVEELLLEKVRYLHGQVGSDNLCLAGGVALNCVANGRIGREGPFERLFVQPAAGDAGGALGAAAAAHVRRTGRPLSGRLEHAYLGPGYDGDEIAGLVSSLAADALDFRDKEADLLSAVADRLASGKIIGWFQGRMEFGPRALGARSILADPRDATMRDRINALVKKREAFRPFAPAVLESAMKQHFELDAPSPFMLRTCQVISKLDLPAITHVDGSARVQTVSASESPRFAALLEEFDRRTGCPILLNTSFNVRGEPIVCTPEDAIICFVRAGIDALVLGDFLIDRDGVSSAMSTSVRALSSRSRAGSHRVYTFV